MNLVELSEILPYLFLRKLHDKGNYYQSCCPIHNDVNPSFVIYKNSYHCRCFSCGANGHIYSILKKVTGKSIYDTFDSLSRNFKNNLFNSSISKNQKTNKQKHNYNNVFFSIQGTSLSVFDNTDVLSYIRKKNITDKFINDFNIKYMTFIRSHSERMNEKNELETSDKKYKNRLLIPIKANNKIINYELRDFTGNHPAKVLYIKYCSSSTLFNIDKLDRNKPLYLVEGILDLPQIYTYISTNCTAIFGISITPKQIQLLNEFKEIIFIPDNDLQGLQFVSNLYEVLETEFYIALLKRANDPGDATLFQLEKAIDNKIMSVKYFLIKYGIIENSKRTFLW